MPEGELHFYPLARLAGLIEARQLSPVELTRVYLDRVERLNPILRAFITMKPDALEVARRAEKEILAGRYKGPLHGIPVAVKDQFYTAGLRTTGGSRAFADFVPAYNATVVQRLEEAGAILLGKNNLSELAMGGTRDHPFGTPRNPWNPEHNPGESSSGSAAAVTATLCAAALGEDTGGSVRGPASFCGIVGLRPTWGRVSRWGSFALSWSMDCAGPLTRTVEDCAIFLGAIAGHDPKDPTSSPEPVPNYRQAIKGGIAGLKIGLLKEFFEADYLDPEVRKANEKAAGALAGLGAHLQEVSIPAVTAAGAGFMSLADAEGAGVYFELIRERGQALDRSTRARLMAASLLPASIYQRSLRFRSLLRQQMLEALEQMDILLCPTMPFPATKIVAGETGFQSFQEAANRLFHFRGYTTPHALAGIPAISVPCGFTGTGLPIGLQLAARPFAEPVLFRAAHAYQESTAWHLKRPPIS
ncbi:MAG: amidase [Chloroflexi bacterium]|nr:amidase [Chloroflexota bacterium]